MFAPELQALDGRARQATAAAIHSLTQLETLDLYRLHRGLSRRETQAQLAIALHALLDHPVPP